MKLRKMRHRISGENQVAVEVSGNWMLVKQGPNDLLELLEYSFEKLKEAFELISYKETDYEDTLPFQPVAYRDFMLYEKHAINAARGFVQKYLPRLRSLVAIYERLTGKTFPMLKPSRRYYQYPIYYMGNHLNFMTNNQPIAIPVYTKELDYELEIAAIITKPLKNASVDEVANAIGGYVILNDFSARDVQLDEMKSGFGPMKSKNFGNAISSIVISKSEIQNKIDDLNVRVLINDHVVAESSTQGKLYSFEEAIAYASWEENLYPGELFGSGTLPLCTGIENGRMLKSGDRISLEVDKLGTLNNTVI